MAVQGAAAVCLPPAKPQCGQGRMSAAPAVGGWGWAVGGARRGVAAALWPPGSGPAPVRHHHSPEPHRAAPSGCCQELGSVGCLRPQRPQPWEATPCINPSLPPHRDTQLLRKPLSPWAALPMTCPLPGPHNHQKPCSDLCNI